MMSLIGTTRPTSATVGGSSALGDRQPAQPLIVDAVGDDLHPLRRGAEADLRRLVGAVQRDDLGAGLVAGAGVALERRRPEVAQVAARIVDGEALVDGVDDPVGLQDLDAALVGVDAVLGDQHRPAGLDRGARRQQPRIAGRDRVIDPRRRQRERQRRDQSAEQRAPRPEEMQEQLVRHGAVVEIADELPGQIGVEQVGGAPCLHQRRQEFDDPRQFGKPAGVQKRADRLVEFRLVEGVRPPPAAAPIGGGEIEMVQRREVGQRAVLRFRRRRLGQDRDDAEAWFQAAGGSIHAPRTKRRRRRKGTRPRRSGRRPRFQDCWLTPPADPDVMPPS